MWRCIDWQHETTKDGIFKTTFRLPGLGGPTNVEAPWDPLGNRRSWWNSEFCRNRIIPYIYIYKILQILFLTALYIYREIYLHICTWFTHNTGVDSLVGIISIIYFCIYLIGSFSESAGADGQSTVPILSARVPPAIHSDHSCTDCAQLRTEASRHWIPEAQG